MTASGESTASPRDYLAAERTFLAWIRTSLALMGLGFVLARFGLFLQEFALDQPAAHVVSYGLSLWFGTALIFAGVLVALFSLLRYVKLLEQLRRGEIAAVAKVSVLAVAAAVILAALGVAMTIYLFSTRPTNNVKSGTPKEASMSTSAQAPAQQGIVRIASNHSVDETVGKIQEILAAKGVKLFALVDHSGEAQSAGLKMPNTKLLIFGNPKGGTPIMLAAPGTALDLPLKILVAEDATGKVWISYNSPEYLQARHGFPGDLLPNIAIISGLANKAAE
jgi:uncharacterized protein (DUF302 family)/uncharacterized membrane protein YidH (DUF202 family)